MNEEVWTEELLKECKTIERRLRKHVHAPDCEGDPDACPRGCGCDPHLSDFTAILWTAAGWLEYARWTTDATALHERLAVLSVLRNTVCFHHELFSNSAAGTLQEAVDLIKQVYKRACTPHKESQR